jgi:hypothetical protein
MYGKQTNKTIKSVFTESLGEWFFLHYNGVFTKWELCKIITRNSYSYKVRRDDATKTYGKGEV